MTNQFDFTLKLSKYILVLVIVVAVAVLLYTGKVDGKDAIGVFLAVLGYLFGVAHNAGMPSPGVRSNGQPTPLGPPKPPGS